MRQAPTPSRQRRLFDPTMSNQATTPATEDTPESRPRVLFVDDEPSVLSAMKRVFRGQGFEILTAGSGQEGLDLMNISPVDLVISDMRMPEMDGAQFLEQVFLRWPDTKRILELEHGKRIDIEGVGAGAPRCGGT